MDYNKLTVVKLREELVNRSLPKTGLKAELVKRLNEHDAQKAVIEEEPDASSVEGGIPEDVSNSVDGEIHDVAQGNTMEGKPNVPAPNPPGSEQGMSEFPPRTTVGKSDRHAELSTVEPDPEPSTTQAELSSSDLPLTRTLTSGACDISRKERNVNEVADTKFAKPQTPESATALAPSLEKQETQASMAPPLPSTQVSVTIEELREDSNKRKRRSQSPPPSSVETSQKRARTSDVERDAHIPEDADRVQSRANGDDEDKIMKEAPLKEVAFVSRTNGHTEAGDHDIAQNESGGNAVVVLSDPAQIERPRSRSPSLKNQFAIGTAKERSTSPQLTSPSKPSAADSRFKGLFKSTSVEESAHTQAEPPTDLDDRTVSPALHPATPALYIRDLMRPLQPQALKKYLVSLASLPKTSPDPEIMTTFFLDSIRTHCLVTFVSTAAASRVRSALHERVWPDEKDRKPLWIDFVPEEKIQKWIDVEGGGGGVGGAVRPSMSKRWEVIYEEEDGEITAYLQEAELNSGPPKGVVRAQPAPKQGHSASSTAPPTSANAGRAREPVETNDEINGTPAAAATAAKAAPAETSFHALESLFRSTTAKPKLYYLPAPQKSVDERLKAFEDEAHDRRGAHRDETEFRRCTFDAGNRILDKGIERGRAPLRRGRGGGPPSYRGVGGYRGGGGGGGGGYGGRGAYRAEDDYGRGRGFRDDGGYGRRGGYRDDDYRR